MNFQLQATDGHILGAYRADPASSPRGAVVVLQEIFGVNRHIRGVTDRFAAAGYLAIAPAMFDRHERGVDLGYTADGIAAGRALKARAQLPAAMLDVSAAVEAAQIAGKVGIVGYCWGGLVTWVAAAEVSGLACAVPYYGAGIPEHGELQPRCPVLGHFGERDKSIPAADVRALAARHPSHTFHLYDADHGFHCDERGSYDAAAATLAHERTLAFFAEHLR